MKKITPTDIVNKLRENQNNNGSLKSLFASQFLGKLSDLELKGLKKNIEKEEFNRRAAEVESMKSTLEKLGYDVKKKK
jgi:hypothetical protein